MPGRCRRRGGCRTWRIERLNHLGGQIHAGFSPDQSALRGVENEVHALLLGDLVDHGRQLAVEFSLDLLRQLLDFLLRVFGEPLQIALLPFDVRLELCLSPESLNTLPP